ncbi:MAG TPA: HAD-IIIC family phosphatase [Longimicrobium sp.]|jgi:FkbH-like protein
MPDAPAAPTTTPIAHSGLLQALEAEAALRDLGARLEEAAARAHPAPATLEALARLDPAAAVAWLLEVRSAARTLFSDADLRRVLDVLAGEVLARGDAALVDLAVAFAATHADAVAPETVVALAAAVPGERRPDALARLVARQLDRLPAHPGLLRLAAELAVAAGDGPRGHALLARLGRADPSPATVGWIARARGGLPPQAGAPARVALLSSFTIDPLKPFLDLELRAAGVVPELYAAPFNAWEREVLDPAAGLRAFAPDAVFLSAALDDLVPALAGTPSPDELRAAGETAVERVCAAARALREWSDAPLVVHAFHTAYPDPLGAAAPPGASRGAWLAELNGSLAGRLADLPAVHLLDVQDLLARRPGGAPEEPKLRHLARMRVGPAVLPELARAYAGYVVPLRGLTRKCVVVDLDNTLWGGVVGEDGPAGLRLGDTSPGSEYVDFQRALAALAARGVLLAAVSKNNEADALEVIRAHPAMVLREEHFAALRINWQPKHENVLAVAAELGIGADSLVFLDDNPDERELMRQMLPEVLTPDLPADPALYRAAVERLPQLQALAVTGEDRGRAALYRARRGRERAREGAPSLEQFLHSLEIAAEAALAGSATLPRVAQLFQRTNQFNLTARRHDAARLAALAADPGWRLWTLSAGDRFSDHGLVGAALVRVGGDAWTVDSLLLSCRAIGYGLETALLAVVCDAARAAGATRLEGEFVESAKNRPAAGFWVRHGFALRSSEDGVETWERGIAAGAVAPPAWIRLTVRDAS